MACVVKNKPSELTNYTLHNFPREFIRKTHLAFKLPYIMKREARSCISRAIRSIGSPGIQFLQCSQAPTSPEVIHGEASE